MGRKSSINKVKRDNSKSKNLEASLVMDLYLKGHSPITTRFTGVGFAECDVLSISKSDYIYEYELKVSRSDFKADFKKDKHRLIAEKKFVNETVTWHIPFYAPNYFYYVVPENLIKLEEIPEYAGLIYLVETVDGRGKPYSYFDIKKKAPVLHKTKASNELIRRLAHQLMCKLVFKKVE